MSDKELENYTCPNCGAEMVEAIGADFELICPECEKVGGIDYDKNGDPYIELWSEGSFGSKIVDDRPEYCIICDGPYPNCQTSCKFFDD